MDKKIIVDFYDLKRQRRFDLEVPINITALELLNGIKASLESTNNRDNLSTGSLISENPIALLKGNKTLKEYGLHDGSTIIYQ